VRKPATPDQHNDLPGAAALRVEETYKNAQRNFISRPDVKKILDDWLGTAGFEEYEDIPESIRKYAHRPHPKRDLRIHTRDELNASGDMQSRLFVRGVLYKMKMEEIGKIGKFPRMIGDLGVAASLQGFYITELLKYAMRDNPIFLNDMECQVVIDPKPGTLIDVFTKLINPPKRGFFALYSDDACLSIRIDGEVRMFNLDIASCDTSHTGKLFERLVETTPARVRDDMNKLKEQCQLPIRVVDVNDPRNVVVLKPNEPTLYSGSTLTTVINCLANVLIFLSIATSDIRAPSDINDAAERAGYIVTGTKPEDECKTYHQIQFLKHSPVYDTKGKLRPMKNLGVLLRSMGSAMRDLPGTGPLNPRASAFMKGFLHGTYPYAHIKFVDTIKTHFQDATVDQKMHAYVKKHVSHEVYDEYEEWSVDDAEYGQRYGLTKQETDEMNELATYAKLETTIECEAINKVLKLDYGLAIFIR